MIEQTILITGCHKELVEASCREYVDEQLDLLLNVPPHRALLIEGGAEGVDRWGRNWAKSRAVPIQTIEAQWDQHGFRAGPIRNRLMISQAAKLPNPSVLSVWEGTSAGTFDCTLQSLKKSLPVRMLYFDKYFQPTSFDLTDLSFLRSLTRADRLLQRLPENAD